MKPGTSFPKSKMCIVTLLIFVFVTGTGIYLTTLLEDLRASERSLVIKKVAVAHASQIERSLGQALASTYAISQILRYRDGEVGDFPRLAASIMEQMPEIANLQIAPGGVIAEVYPMENHASIIGHDVLNEDSHRAEALQAVVSRQLTLAGPFELKQGGTGIVGRYPVFVGDGKGQFWGFVTALIMLDDLLASSGIRDLEGADYLVSLGRIGAEGEGSVFYTNSEEPLAGLDPVEVSVQVPGAEWFIRMAYRPQPFSVVQIISQAAAIALALALAIMGWRLMKEPERLRVRVDEQMQDLEILAYSDALTALPNRQYLMSRINEAIRASGIRGRYYVLLIDIDQFRDINETLGYDVGDRLLIALAERIRMKVPATDEVGRLGGDEFIVLTNCTGDDCASHLADQLLADLSSEFTIGEHRLTVTSSIGIALINGTAESAYDVLDRAGQAVRVAKHKTRNSSKFFSEKLQQRADHLKRLARDLPYAVSGNQLRILYQPIVSAQTGAITKAEALLRWEHPQLGMVGPMDFIPIAEDTGSILEIGQWVFEKGTSQITHWQQRYNPNLQLSLNLSPVQLRSDRHVASLLGMLNSYPGMHRQIQVEITEGILLEDNQRVQTVMKNLSSSGIEIAVDDFGTGYSSLSYLKNFSIDYLKIDRSFVSNMATDSDDLALCEGIILIAQRLGLSVVAEGVETIEQHNLLVNAGVDFLQGYLYSRPVEAEEFEKLLDAGGHMVRVFSDAA